MTVIYMFAIFYVTQSDASDVMKLLWVGVMAASYFFDAYEERNK